MKKEKEENALLVMYKNNLVIKIKAGIFPKRSVITPEPCIVLEVNVGGFDEFGNYYIESNKKLRKKLLFSSEDWEALDRTLSSIINTAKEQERSIQNKLRKLKKMTYKIGAKLYANDFKLLMYGTETLNTKKLINGEKEKREGSE